MSSSFRSSGTITFPMFQPGTAEALLISSMPFRDIATRLMSCILVDRHDGPDGSISAVKLHHRLH